MIHKAYIAFGANRGEPAVAYRRAVDQLAAILGPIIAESALYETEALTLEGTEPQANYVNAVFVCATAYSPREILNMLLETERVLGRDRSGVERWAPRTIDLDLLFVDGYVVKDEALTLPHPELHKRDFVLRPLCDVAPELIHPLLGESIRSLEASLETRGCERFVVRAIR